MASGCRAVRWLGLPLLCASGSFAAGASLPTPASRLGALVTTAGTPSDHVVATPGFLDGVARLVISRPGGTFGCSGALVGQGLHVLTAAHCVSGPDGAVDVSGVAITFAAATGGPQRAGIEVRVAPGWTGDFRDGADLALIRLSAPVVATVYDIVRDPNAGIGATVTIAGYGRSGSGVSGAGNLPFGTLRAGRNRIDTVWDERDITAAPFAFDFDDGTPARDTIGNLIPQLADLGTGSAEVMIAPGDSGGPSFLGTRLVGVHSFGGTFGTPYDLDDAFNATFGELGGDTRVAVYAGWIDSLTLSVPVPEPKAWLLFGTGLALLWCRRSRRRDTSPATR